MTEELEVINAVQKHLHVLREDLENYDPLLDLIGNSTLVLLGEATHGTHEFYRARAQITQALIERKDFRAVAVEADWPDAYRVNRYVRLLGRDVTSEDALEDFKRFPTWMWRNTDIVDFIRWLREYNAALDAHRRVGFYGLDLYGLNQSMAQVVQYLEKTDPQAARWARDRYACFDQFGGSEETYGHQAGARPDKSCERDIIAVLVELQRKAEEYVRRDGLAAEDEFFCAEQNARVARNAERYYRAMFEDRTGSWNLRDRHMAETLDALSDHLSRQGFESKIVVWAHNSHVGDARATDFARSNELNVGQLMREKHGLDAALVGLTTYEGTVTAAGDWGGPLERKDVRPGLPGSVEDLAHRTEIPRFLLILRNNPELAVPLAKPREERAIGVIYLPETERASHYFETKLSQQFDALIHFDRTQAVQPLERTPEWDSAAVPETYPSAV